MKIEVRFRGVDPSDALRRHAVRRIHFHLSRFAPEIRAVMVRLEDQNGPRGGVDKRCRVLVRGPRIGAATLADLSADAYAAIDRAVLRIGRTVARSLARGRARRTGTALRRGCWVEVPSATGTPPRPVH